jgi:hypothetical protein
VNVKAEMKAKHQFHDDLKIVIMKLGVRYADLLFILDGNAVHHKPDACSECKVKQMLWALRFSGDADPLLCRSLLLENLSRFRLFPF